MHSGDVLAKRAYTALLFWHADLLVPDVQRGLCNDPDAGSPSVEFVDLIFNGIQGVEGAHVCVPVVSDNNEGGVWGGPAVFLEAPALKLYELRYPGAPLHKIAF